MVRSRSFYGTVKEKEMAKRRSFYVTVKEKAVIQGEEDVLYPLQWFTYRGGRAPVSGSRTLGLNL